MVLVLVGLAVLPVSVLNDTGGQVEAAPSPPEGEFYGTQIKKTVKSPQ